MRQRSSSYILNAATIIFPFQTQWVPICSLLEIEPFALLMHTTPFAIQKVRSLTPLLSFLPDWEGNATVCVFDNHHILKVTSSSLQSVGDRTFCIAVTHPIYCHAESSIFNTCAEPSAGLGRKRHCLCILQFWEPSYSESDIFLSAICWRSNFLYCWYTDHLLPCKKFCL